MSEPNPDVRPFLKRVMYTMTAGLVWLGINTTFGIMKEYGFIREKISAGNIVFYTWLLLSFIALIWYFRRMWKGHI
jgi:hypothetical protein